MQGNALAATLLLTAIVIGFVHGLMKVRYRSPLVTFAFDIPLTISFAITLLSIKRGRNIFPVHPISSALKMLIGLCALYGLLPFGLPFLVTLAAFRGWCFIPLIFLLGYHLTRSRQQLDAFIWLLLLLGLITLLYGMRQTPEEVRRMMQADSILEARFRNQFYATKSGSQFRVFSTFVSSGAFGSTMAFCSLFAVGRMISASIGTLQRLILMALFGGLVYGILLSGSRSSLLLLGIGLVVITAFIRRIRLPVISVLALGAIATLSTVRLNENMLGRFRTLLDPTELFGRIWIVIFPGWRELSEQPWGWGLGRSGHGVPGSLLRFIGPVDWKPIDGDLGKLMVDFGVLGILMLSWLLYVATREIFRVARDLGTRDEGRIVLPAAGWFLGSVFTVSVGSPFLGIPTGALTWFFLGASVRLHEIAFGAYGAGKRRPSLLERRHAAALEDVSPQSAANSGLSADQALAAERVPGSAPRFLYSGRRSPDGANLEPPGTQRGNSKVRRLFD